MRLSFLVMAVSHNQMNMNIFSTCLCKLTIGPDLHNLH